MFETIQQQLQPIIEAFPEDASLYLVGGTVRNTLLGLSSQDLDICSGRESSDVQTAWEKAGLDVSVKNRHLGTLEIRQGDIVCEYTPFRMESYSQGGHTPDRVLFGISLEQDARRRDFSCNAIYWDLRKHELLDPTGGLDDLRNRQLRAARPNARETFADDPLRLLRMIRLAGELSFDIQPDTLSAASAQAPLLSQLSPERIWQELQRILLCDARYATTVPLHEVEACSEPVLRVLQLLLQTGALGQILPELIEGLETNQNLAYHAHPVLAHNLRTASATPPDLALRLTGLLHDVGKPRALKEQGNFHGHDKRGALMAQQMLARLRCPQRLNDTVCRLIAHHMFDLAGNARPCTIARHLSELSRKDAQRLILLRRADVIGSGRGTQSYTADRWQQALDMLIAEHAPATPDDLALNGHAIMMLLNLPPSQEIGRMKQRLFRHVVCHPHQNNAESLKRLLLQWYP